MTQQEFKALQKEEAVQRLKLLKMHPNVLREFKSKNTTLYYSERQNVIFDGILYFVNNVPEFAEAIREFDDKYNALVYHAQLSHCEFGDCLSLLYVSGYPEDWEQEKNDLIEYDETGILSPYSYVVNFSNRDYSEFGRIGIIRRNGGISRIY